MLTTCMPLQAALNSLRSLRSDAVYCFQATAGDKLSQISQRSNFEFLMQHGRGLGTYAGEFQKVQHCLRCFSDQPVPGVERSALEQVHNLACQGFADTWNLL